MTIYDKSISNLAPADLQQLLDEDAVENIRLEFKRQDVPKDAYLTKLSGFANTYGGYLIVGAEEDGNGKLVALPGVDPIPGFKQRTLQWCYEGVYPLLQPNVSDPSRAAKPRTRCATSSSSRRARRRPTSLTREEAATSEPTNSASE